MKNSKGLTRPCKNSPECDGEVRIGAKARDGVEILACHNCRARFLSWLKRTPTEVLRYVTELRKRNTRMEEVREERSIGYKPTQRR